MTETKKFKKIILDKICYFLKKDIDEIRIIDVGCGNDPIYKKCETIDLHIQEEFKKMTYVGNALVLPDIVRGKFDVVYSSHLLEDFYEDEMKIMINRWKEVLKPNGIFVFLLPDQKKYLNCCLKSGCIPNPSHKLDFFGFDYIKRCFFELDIDIVFKKFFWEDNSDPYNFMVIGKPSNFKNLDQIPLPSKIEIESSSVCNVNPPCCMCVRNIVKDKGFLDDDVLEKISKYAKYFSHVSLHGIGEVMLYPKIEKLVETFSHAEIGFTTGGHLLNKESIEFLVDRNLDFLSISIDAATKETHDKIRGTGFHPIIENIKYLQYYKNKKKKSSPYLIMNAVVMKENVYEIPKIIELAWTLDANHVTLVRLSDDFDFIINRKGYIFNYEGQKTKNFKELHDKIIIISKKTADYLKGISLDTPLLYNDKNKKNINIKIDFERLDKLEKIVPSTKGFSRLIKTKTNNKSKVPLICKKPWDSINVSWNGDVRNCCHQVGKLGSLKDNSLEEIWYGEESKEVRQKILNNEFHTFCKSSKNKCYPRQKVDRNKLKRSTYLFYGLSRSGHHAIINWFIKNDTESDISYLNDFNFGESNNIEELKDFFERSKNSNKHFVSLENKTENYIEDKQIEDIFGEDVEIKRIFIFRDPYNWVSSFLKHKKINREYKEFNEIEPKLKTFIDIMKNNIKYSSNNNCQIIYNKWVSSKEYRDKIAEDFGFKNDDKGFLEVSEEGGGSSFDGMKYNNKANQMKVLERWEHVDRDIFERFINNDLKKFSEEVCGFSLPKNKSNLSFYQGKIRKN